MGIGEAAVHIVIEGALEGIARVEKNRVGVTGSVTANERCDSGIAPVGFPLDEGWFNVGMNIVCVQNGEGKSLRLHGDGSEDAGVHF